MQDHAEETVPWPVSAVIAKHRDVSTDYTQIRHRKTNCRLMEPVIQGQPSWNDYSTTFTPLLTHFQLGKPTTCTATVYRCWHKKSFLSLQESKRHQTKRERDGDGYTGNLATVMLHCEKTKTSCLYTCCIDSTVSRILIWQHLPIQEEREINLDMLQFFLSISNYLVKS